MTTIPILEEELEQAYKDLNYYKNRNEKLNNQLQQKENIIEKVREYIKKDTRWFDSEYAKTYGELCTCKGANSNRLELLVNPSNLLKILDKEKGSDKDV